MAWLDLRFLWWLSPIVFSLILSPLVSVFSSRANLGLACQRVSLFLIPEEYSPPKELVDTENYLRRNRARVLLDGFRNAVMDPAYNALATGMATARHGICQAIERNREDHIQSALHSGPGGLTAPERLAVISDPVILSRLHLRLWSQPQAWPAWDRK